MAKHVCVSNSAKNKEEATRMRNSYPSDYLYPWTKNLRKRIVEEFAFGGDIFFLSRIRYLRKRVRSNIVITSSFMQIRSEEIRGKLCNVFSDYLLIKKIGFVKNIKIFRLQLNQNLIILSGWVSICEQRFGIESWKLKFFGTKNWN